MMMTGPLEYRHIDTMIDEAIHGDEVLPYPINEQFMAKLEELAANPDSHDPEQLRQEGYREVDRKNEFRRMLARERNALAVA